MAVAETTASRRSSLSPAQVQAIRRRRLAGESCGDVARDFGVSRQTVSLIGRGLLHPPDPGEPPDHADNRYLVTLGAQRYVYTRVLVVAGSEEEARERALDRIARIPQPWQTREIMRESVGVDDVERLSEET